MKLYVLFVVCMFLFLSCERSPLKHSSFDTLMPLAVGNEWHYVDKTNKNTMVDKVVSKSNLYWSGIEKEVQFQTFKIERCINGSSSPVIMYYCVYNDFIYISYERVYTHFCRWNKRISKPLSEISIPYEKLLTKPALRHIEYNNIVYKDCYDIYNQSTMMQDTYSAGIGMVSSDIEKTSHDEPEGNQWQLQSYILK